MHLYRVTAPWSENTVTWNYPWVQPGGDFDSTISFENFHPDQTNCMIALDLTDLVQLWVNGTYPNSGFLLYGTGPNSSIIYVSKENSIAEQRPKLDVSYSLVSTPRFGDGIVGLIDTVTGLWDSLVSIVVH
jgi:hypothetical protein